MAIDRIYCLFYEAKNRCTNQRNKDFSYYGGRGIRFEFQSVEEFRSALGPRSAGATLDRIDTNGPYSSANCRWATRKEQGRNTRRNRRVRGKTLSEWAEALRVDESLIRWRLDQGWPVEKALVGHTYRRGKGGGKFKLSQVLLVAVLILTSTLNASENVLIRLSGRIVTKGEILRITCKVPKDARNRLLVRGIADETTSDVQLDGEQAAVTHTLDFRPSTCGENFAFCALYREDGQPVVVRLPFQVVGLFCN